MEYAYTSLVVEDVKSAAAFYEQAFAFTLDHAHDEWDYAELRTGLTRISLVAPSLVEAHLPIAVRVNKADEMPAGFELTLVADDVDAAFDRVGRAGEALAAYEQLLADQQRILGPDHPSTFITRSNLAGALHEVGRTATRRSERRRVVLAEASCSPRASSARSPTQRRRGR